MFLNTTWITLLYLSGTKYQKILAVQFSLNLTVYCVLYVLSRSTIEEELMFPSNTCYM